MPQPGHLNAGSFVDRVAACIDRRALPAPGAKVLVAVSGGADSVALLLCLVELALQPARRYQLGVAHLDHGLRPDAAADARFVADLAAEFDLEVVCERIDVAEEAARTGQSIETAARRVRYGFLQAAAVAGGCEAIATAHHAADNVETVLHRILRGTGVGGLAGIPFQRACDGPGDLRIIRPMLAVTAADAKAYLTAGGRSWRTDATNADIRHTRNRIRHELLPLLRQYNPRVDDAIAKLARTAARAAEILAEVGQSALADVTVDADPGQLALDAAALTRMGAARAAETFCAALAQLGAPMQGIGFDHIERLLDLPAAPDGRGRVELPGGLTVTLGHGVLTFGAAGTPEEMDASDPPFDSHPPCELTWPGTTALADGGRLVVTIDEGAPADLAAFFAAKPPTVEMLDADAVVGPVFARRWRRGDRFRPLGAPGAQKLSDFFGSAKIDPADRRRAWIIADARGVIWVSPHRIDERVKITDSTRRVATVRLAEVATGPCTIADRAGDGGG